MNKIITLDEGWKKINTNGILKLHRIIKNARCGGEVEKFSHQEYADLYTTIYNMCIQKLPHCYTPQLYRKYETSINEYLSTVVLPALESNSNEYLVKEVVVRWEDHKIMKKWLHNFFCYLDRFYVKRHSKTPLKDVCINRFHVMVFEKIKTRLTPAILELIEKDRNREEIDRGMLRDAIQIYVEMGMGETKVYVAEFENHFIKTTSTFYGRAAATWLAVDSCPEYLRKTESRLEEERKRLENYLHSSSEEKLMQTIYQELLIQHQKAILGKENTGCKSMLEAQSEDDLSRMYSLYNLVPSSLVSMAYIVQKHISDVGNNLINRVNNERNHQKYVINLIKIHEKYYNLVLNCFDGNTVFQKALKDAFEQIVNQRTYQSSTAELLAQYSDRLLKKGGVRMDGKELQTTLDNIVRLFTYLTDKDMFSEFYRKMLSKRLLLQKSASNDAEKSMIGKLKLRCGAQYTSKLEGMINDMRSADDHVEPFNNFIQKNHATLGLDFQVQTLTTGFWPTYKTDEIKLPVQMQKCVDCFKMYYNTKTNNRRLRWIHKLGVVTMTGRFIKRPIDLVVSTIQASILILFNENEELSIAELIKYTNLAPNTMKRQLRSLVSGKFKILMKNPSSGYKTSHKMRVNKKFTHQQRKIHIPNVVMSTTAKERGAAQETVKEDRRHAIEANVVRIMKARKTMEHAQLMTEVSQHLFQFFRPDPRQIKKRIEDLIAREYLERDVDKSNVYHYLA